jgi:hypothetical protein
VIVKRPDIVRRYMAMQGRALGALGLRGHFPGPLRHWAWRSGADVLVCWEGERLPYPSLDPWKTDERQAAVVGLAPGSSGSVDTFDDVTFADGVYQFAVVAFGPGGVPAEIDPLGVRTRVFDSGQLVGLLPNPPSLVQARRLAADKPCVSWTYSRVGEQVTPQTFELYACDEDTEFNCGSAAGSVTFEAGRRRYSWTGVALSPGDVRYYTVRAVSAGSVKSLIPRNGRCPAGDYDSVVKEYCARLEIPAGPPVDVGTLGVEVLDEW